MKKVIFIGVLLVIAQSCNFSNRTVVDQIALQRVEEKPILDSLFGIWNADSFSYDFVNEHYQMENKKMVLELRGDRTFTIKNAPSFDSHGNPTSDSLMDVSGKWKLRDLKNKWYLDMRYQKNIGLVNNLSLYTKDNSFVIMAFIGDPDSDNRLLFTKE